MCVAVLRCVLSILAVWIIPTSSEHCDRLEVVDGCNVTDGHAHCVAWDLPASIQALPACTTNITFQVIANPKFVKVSRFSSTFLNDINFTHLTNLLELQLFTERSNHSHVRLDDTDSPAFIPPLVENLRALKLRIRQSAYTGDHDWENAAMYSRFKSLDVLEFSRAQRIGLSHVIHVIGQRPSMTKLILKNVQEINRETYTPLVNISQFICGSKVRHLDLSYNDIVSLNLVEPCIEGSSVQYLDLRQNILANNFLDNPMNLVTAYSLLPNITMIKGSVWSKDEYQYGLWNDEDIPEDSGYITTQHKYTGFLPDVTQGDLLRFVKKYLKANGEINKDMMKVYGFWVDDLIEHCILSHGLGIFSTVPFLSHDYHGDVCKLIEAMDPDVNITRCPDDVPHQFEFFMKNMCDYKHCSGMPVPVPPTLTSVSFHDFGRYNKIVTDPPTGSLELCIHPHNNLKRFDIPYIQFASLQNFTFNYNVSGFKKLRYLNAHGHKLPVLFSQLNIKDMDCLEELHIGGSILASDGVIRSHMLRPFTRLSLLNMTDAKLVGLESDVFLEHNNLTVLDLSHNQLTTTSLASIDLSKTKVRNLNLSYNRFTTIPASLRGQLDRLENLQLHLSGNNFLCSCDNLEFLQWVQQHDSSITFHFQHEHLCVDSPGNTIHNIAIDSLRCNWYWEQPLIAVGSSVALTLLFTTAIGLYKKRWYISNLIFRLKESFCLASEDTPAVPYRYDAFVLYSSVDDDRTWVHYKLVDELEKVYGFRLCIHHRDFLGGCGIVDSIDKAIRCSRKVLVVMSGNFLRSDWCLEEFSMAASTDRRKLVVIMYKDVMLADVHIPPVVRHVLGSRTYIEWDEHKEAQQLFWKKLRRALHSKQPTPSQQSRDQEPQGLRNQCLLLSDIEIHADQ